MGLILKKYLFRNYDLPRSLLFLLLSRRNTQKSAYILWECVKNINKSYLQYQLCVLQKSDFYSSWHFNFFYPTEKYLSHAVLRFTVWFTVLRFTPLFSRYTYMPFSCEQDVCQTFTSFRSQYGLYIRVFGWDVFGYEN